MLPERPHAVGTPAAIDVQLEGVLGDALAASRRGRLFHFITGPHSPAIALFDAAHTAQNLEGDWYGEHAGKWLIAAARAAANSDDTPLRNRVCAVADHLIALQGDDGYLGTYAPSRRFTAKPPPPDAAALPTWDGAPTQRTWDVWVHSYLVLGLLEVHRHFQHAGALQAACRIGDLFCRTLGTEEPAAATVRITQLGNHFGLSATVLMDPAMELHRATGEPRYLRLALQVLQQADAEPGLRLLQRALQGADAAEIGTGKAYQLCWNLVGLAKIHRATGDPLHRQALDHLWHSIHSHHLTLGGGPWGGVAHRSREVFNAPGSFSTQAFVETCSTLAWVQLNRELLAITGDVRHAEAIETSAYNDLLGAIAPNGEDWCYYRFDNGRRVHTTHWRCCKSSGAMALEELPALAYAVEDSGAVRVQLYGPSRARLQVPRAGFLTLRQVTYYPFDGRVVLQVEPESPARFELRLRIPAWAQGARVLLNGSATETPCAPGTWASLSRLWQPGDQIELQLPLQPRLHQKVLKNVQESRAPDGTLVRQEVLNHAYVAFSRGPLVYATGLIDGYKTEETVHIPAEPLPAWVHVLPQPAPDNGATLRVRFVGRPDLDYVPSYRADGREDGAWRITWLAVAPAGPSSNFL